MDDATLMVIAGAAFAVSEALSLIPAVRANGVFQLVVQVLRMVARR